MWPSMSFHNSHKFKMREGKYSCAMCGLFTLGCINITGKKRTQSETWTERKKTAQNY